MKAVFDFYISGKTKCVLLQKRNVKNRVKTKRTFY